MRVLHKTNSAEMIWMQGGEEKVCNSYMRKRRTCKRKQEVENSEVHLLPVFALPPRGGEDEKNSRGEKRREINAHHHKHLEQSDRTGQTRSDPWVQRPKSLTTIRASSGG